LQLERLPSPKIKYDLKGLKVLLDPAICDFLNFVETYDGQLSIQCLDDAK